MAASISFTSHSGAGSRISMGSSNSKSSRSRGSVSVKPILKKLHSSSHSYTHPYSHSEKNSLDLDRGWEEQPYFPGYTSVTTSHSHPDDQLYTFTSAGVGAGAGARADLNNFSSDINNLGGLGLTTTSTAATSATGTSSGFTVTPTLSSTTTAATTVATLSSHARSISGNSIATSGSAGRNGSFVHPFQQTPRTSTPPLLPYATARASLDNCYISGSSSNLRDYSSTTITETDDADTDGDVATFGYPSRASTLPQSHSTSTASLHKQQQQQHHHRQSSLPNSSSSPNSPSSEVAIHPLRVATTARSASVVTSAVSASAPRFSSQPRSSVDGHLASASLLASTVAEPSPLSATSSTTPTASSPQMLSSTASTSATSPMSLRHSLDMNNFRIRSRSDVDTQTRQEQVRRARRKFEEKERAKEAKYTREQSRRKERQGSKGAQRREKDSQKSNLHSIIASSRTSSSTFESGNHRPAYSRKSTGASRYNDAPAPVTNEKPDYETGGYDDAFPGQASTADDVHFESSRRTRTKRKNGSPWTAFVLWFRTRLLKLGRR